LECDLSLSDKPFIQKPFCAICGKPIEEKSVLEHYRKHHPNHLKDAQKLGKKLSKESYGRRSRRRQIREQLG